PDPTPPESADLALTVSAWAAGRWQGAVRARPADDLAAAVEKWLVARMAEPSGSTTPGGYAQGRLAQAVADSSEGRWVGLHRRPPRRLLRRR
ncbi:MAG: hypothetical protein HOV79_17730, partial [Hamadaea sp.]|nr:hypothetical protein [Hamadaea sp.]